MNEPLIFEFLDVVQSMYKPGVTNPGQPWNFPHRWVLVKNINADAVTGLTDQKEFMGFVAQSVNEPDQFVVALRGVAGFLDILQGLDFDMVDFNLVPNGGKTEHGFTRFYESFTFIDPDSKNGVSQNLKEYLGELPESASFTVAGYSLGGALGTLHAAVLASRNFKVDVYTIASPMVGNAAFVKRYNSLVNSTIRIVNIPDIVPKLPGAFLGYQHVTAPLRIDSRSFPEINRSITCYHSLSVYLYILKAPHTNLGSCKA